MKKHIIILFVLFCNILAYAQSSFKFIQPTDINGTSPQEAFSFYEDSRGLMWMGTANGLKSYDGYQFKTYRTFFTQDTTVHNKRIRKTKYITEDDNGNLWFGSYGGLLVYKREKDIIERITTIPVMGLKKDKNGQLLFLNKKSVFRLNPNTLAIQKLPLDKLRGLSCLEIDGKENVWLVTKNGITVYNNLLTKKVRIFKNSQFLDFTGAVLKKGKNGNIWIGTKTGHLCKFDIKTCKLSSQLIHHPDARRHRIMGITTGNNNEIWSVTNGGAVLVYNDESRQIQTYKPIESEQNRLGIGQLFTVYQDRKDNIWIGSLNVGVYIYNYHNNAFKHYYRQFNSPQTLPVSNVQCFTQGADGTMWVGTTEGLVYQSKDGFQRVGGNELNHIHTLFTDTDGLVWACIFERLGYIKNGQFSFLTTEMGYPKTFVSARVRDIKEDQEGNLWFASMKGGIFKLNKQTKTVERFVDNRHNDKDKATWLSTRELVLKDTEKIYTATYIGLGIFDRKTKTFSFLKHDARRTTSLSENLLSDVFIDSKNRLWVGTAHQGLNLLIDEEKGIFKRYTENEGLISNYIYGIEEADNGNIWISTDKGLSEFDPEEGAFRNLNKASGLQGDTFLKGSHYKDRQGYLYFGGINGFNTFHPENISQQANVSDIVFTGFKLFNKSLPIGTEPLNKHINEVDTLILDYTQSIFTIEYATPSFTEQKNIEYAYKMEGLDKGWNYVGHTRFASYTSLPTNQTYTFKVKSTNADGIWQTHQKKLTVIVTPPWWETVWFRVLSVLLIICIGISFYKIRTYQLRQHQVELEGLVEERTSELSSANDELLAQRDNLSQAYQVIEEKNTLITDSINYAKRIQGAVLPSDKKMAENFQEYFVLFKPKDVVSGDFYWMAEHENMTFLAVVDCTGHGVPGAFLSMIGSSLLNRIVNEMAIYETDQILTYLNSLIRQALRQKEAKNDDGMDLSLCRIEWTSTEKVNVQFTGAKNDLHYYEQDSEALNSIKGNRKSIGGIRESKRSFTKVEHTFKRGDNLYFSTDGFADQNNKDRIRFSKKGLLKTISEIRNLSMKDQGIYLENILEGFKGDSPQRDDITVLGVRL